MADSFAEESTDIYCRPGWCGGLGVLWQGVCKGWEHWCKGGSCGLWLRDVVRVTSGPYTTGLYKGAAAV